MTNKFRFLILTSYKWPSVKRQARDLERNRPFESLTRHTDQEPSQSSTIRVINQKVTQKSYERESCLLLKDQNYLVN